MTQTLYPKLDRALAQRRSALAPKIDAAFKQFSQAVFADGGLARKDKQLIAVAVAHVTQCPYCIRGHTKAAIRAGATPEQVMEAVWVAAEMRAGAAFAHSALALDALTPTPPAGDPSDSDRASRPAYASPPCFMHELDPTETDERGDGTQ